MIYQATLARGLLWRARSETAHGICSSSSASSSKHDLSDVPLKSVRSSQGLKTDRQLPSECSFRQATCTRWNIEVRRHRELRSGWSLHSGMCMLRFALCHGGADHRQARSSAGADNCV